MIHSLGTDDYGTLLFIWSVTGVLGIMGFGLSEATLRYVAHHYAAGDLVGVNRVFGATLTFYAIMCGIVCVALFVAAPVAVTWISISTGQQDVMVWLLRLAALTFSLNVIGCGAFGAIPIALQRCDVTGKVNIAQSLVRSVGYIVLAVGGFGIFHLVVYDLTIQSIALCVHVIVARRMIPTLRVLPSLSLRGLKQIFGHSIFSFLTQIFLVMYRESGKLALGSKIGPSSVAYFGTPDGVTYRIYMVLVSGGETLLPRFSANRDLKLAHGLLFNATWTSLALAIVLFVPLAAVMPDLLRLWINPEFASHSAATGQLVALCYIAPAGFVPIATFFRGTGKPWIVTAVMAAAGIIILVGCAVLIPMYGVVGVGYAYLLSSIPWLVGLVCGWLYAFGRSSLAALARSAAVPVLLGGIVYAAEGMLRGEIGELTWFGLFGVGGMFACLTALLVLGVDMLIGGEAPSRKLLQRIGASSKFDTIVRRLPVGWAR
jgi:O-antigen/teichoic acid export membrane protein